MESVISFGAEKLDLLGFMTYCSPEQQLLIASAPICLEMQTKFHHTLTLSGKFRALMSYPSATFMIPALTHTQPPC